MTPFVSLYRRFRPGRFDEVRGQDHVVRALQSAVRDGRVAHAYLFSGPRGHGQDVDGPHPGQGAQLRRARSTASPAGVCSSCVEITQGTSLDVHELDAASNNGVDAMRDLVSHAALGTPGRWKVYIVDEVHMLSTPASNALLKTLEEPPGHVVFVLATTDPQKVLPDHPQPDPASRVPAPRRPRRCTTCSTSVHDEAGLERRRGVGAGRGAPRARLGT